MTDGKDLDEEEQGMIVTLTLGDDIEVKCAMLTIFNAGEHKYTTLLPMEGTDPKEGEIYLYRYNEAEDGAPNLDSIEDDGEYETVAEAFDELLDAQEYDELVDGVGEEQSGQL